MVIGMLIINFKSCAFYLRKFISPSRISLMWFLLSMDIGKLIYVYGTTPKLPIFQKSLNIDILTYTSTYIEKNRLNFS